MWLSADKSVANFDPLKNGIFATLLRESERLSTVSLPDEDEIDHVKTDTFAPWLPKTLKLTMHFFHVLHHDVHLEVREPFGCEILRQMI